MDLNSRLNSRRWRLYPHCLMHSWCIGGRHGTPRTSPFGAFYLVRALPRGLDLGTPPIEPLSGERRTGCEVDRV